jgi:folate-binding Fe-S cluster repair protein YgfZ
MDEKELAKLVEWLENMIVNSKLSMSENRDDETMYAYFQGRASAFEECLQDIQIGAE